MSVQRRSKDREPVNHGAGTASTIRTNSRESAKPVGHTAAHPTYDEIALRAYQLFEERGGEPGSDWDDWFLAERELSTASGQRAERLSATVSHATA